MGIEVSRRQPAGTHPCFVTSRSTLPLPLASLWTTHQPLAREMITNVSPLQHSISFVGHYLLSDENIHIDVKLVLLLCHIRVDCYGIGYLDISQGLTTSIRDHALF